MRCSPPPTTRSSSLKKEPTDVELPNCGIAEWSNRVVSAISALRHFGNRKMRYLPKSPADREAMLHAIGVRSIDDLFAPIPGEYRLARDLNVPRQMAESEIVDYFRARAS